MEIDIVQQLDQLQSSHHLNKINIYDSHDESMDMGITAIVSFVLFSRELRPIFKTKATLSTLGLMNSNALAMRKK